MQPPSPPEDDPQQRLPRVRQGVEQQLAEAADRRFQNELLAAVSEYNGRIARHNLLVSTPLLQLTTLTMERLDDLAREEQAT